MQTAKLGSAVLGKMILGRSEPSSPLFIVDRTQEHVDLLMRLRRKGWVNLTDDEKKQWTTEASKGAYNYTDLNRVESAVGKLAENLGLVLTTKTNWTPWDVPTQDEMSRYLGNVVAIRDACSSEMNFPTLPSSMHELTYETANNIEMVLLLVYGSTSVFARSGELYCGEV